MKLHLADGLALPLDAVTQKLAFLGRTGSGKSYGASKLAELLLDAGAQVVVLDPVGIWWGLRLAADGKTPGIAIPVFGGLHGDIPLEPTAGTLLADVVTDRGTSAVLDVSQMLASEQARFAYDFATRFFQRKKAAPSAVHLFIEECQEFVPQNVRGDSGNFESKMLHAFERLIKLGRNFGIGASLISQRPQEVNKKVLNQTELLLAFQTTGPQERKAIAGWVADKGLNVDLDTLLPRLRVGEPHVWSPQWLVISKTVRIEPKRTFDASSTPKFGAAAAQARPLAPIDLEKLRERMASTIEKAKAEDPKELRRRIAQLESEVKKAAAFVHEARHAAPAPEIKTVEVPVLGKPELHRLEEAAGKVLDAVQAVRQASVALAEVSGGVAQVLEDARRLSSRAAIAAAPRPVQTIAKPGAAPLRRPPPPMARGADAEKRPRAGARRMLEAIARRYPVPTTEAQCAQLAKVKRGAGTFGTYKSGLLRGGFMGERGDYLELTDLGWEEIGMTPGSASPQTTDDVLALYAGTIRAGARRMVESLMGVYPSAMDKGALAADARLTGNAGTFGKYLSDLRKAGLVEDLGDEVKASELLMNPGTAS
jgi:hypothetical protein